MNLFMAPTFSEMLISLSFRMMSILRFMSPMVFRAARAMPPVSEPSPMTATTLWSCPCASLASAMPSALARLVLACPTVIASCGDSLTLVKPDSPPSFLMVGIWPRRPVRILWA